MRLILLNQQNVIEIKENFTSLFDFFYGLKKIFKLRVDEFYIHRGTGYISCPEAPKFQSSTLLTEQEKAELKYYQLYLKAQNLVKIWHGSQRYGGFLPYFYHLKQTDKVIDGFSVDIPEGQFFKLKTAALLHDVLEDTPISMKELCEIFGGDIADIVLQVTKIDEQNTLEFEASYYEEMAKNPLSVFVKIADKAANAKQTIKDKSVWHAKRLVKGHPIFQNYTYNKIHAPNLKKYLDSLIFKLEKMI